MELKTRETSNPMPSPEIPDGRVLFLQRFASFMCLDGGNRPLGVREEEERKRGAVVMKMKSETF
jgi:hypothetical protein